MRRLAQLERRLLQVQAAAAAMKDRPPRPVLYASAEEYEEVYLTPKLRHSSRKTQRRNRTAQWAPASRRACAKGPVPLRARSQTLDGYLTTEALFRPRV